MTKDIQFGRPLREKYFDHVDKDVLLVNNGAQGLAPRKVLEAGFQNVLRDYQWPDNYRRNVYGGDYDENTKEVARVIHTDFTNIALGLNVTTMINAVLRSWKWKKGEKILVHNNTYPAILKTIKFVAKQNDLEVVEIKLNYPLSDDQVVSKYEEAYKTNNIRLSIIDTISSKPGVKVPYERLVQLSREYEVLSLVDAAHGIGLLDLDLDKLQPDFLASDLYKWYYTPRGTSFLYVNPKHHKAVHSLPISHFYIDGDAIITDGDKEKRRLLDQFSYTGANLIGNLTTVKNASDFIEEIGGLQKVKDWNFQLARDIGVTISKLWGTSILENEEGTLLSSLVSVQYPIKEGVVIRESDWENLDVFRFIREQIERESMKQQRTTASIFYHNGNVYIRFSAQIFSELADYVEAAKRIEKVVDNYLTSEHYKKLIQLI